MNNMKKRKTLQELNLLDRFLFAKTIEDKETFEAMLEILLDEEIHLLSDPQTEKELRTSPWLRSIRVDVYSLDEAKTVYNAEAQQQNTYNLPKRSRYYEGLIDSSLLEPGSNDFNKLNDVVLITIAPFDIFGYDKYRYTFQMKCKEVEGLYLEDGATRIFYNTHGKNDNEVSPALVELLKYIEHTTQMSDIVSDDERLRKIQEQVNKIKSSERMGVQYMQKWEELLMWKDEGLDEGRETERKATIIEFLEELGTVPEALREKIMKESDMEVLKTWRKAAARVESLEKFEEVIVRKES